MPTETALLPDPNEEIQVKAVVEAFGKKLNTPALQAADAKDQMQQAYAEFVSPELLDTWTRDLSYAPGHIVSSPWPDRIEIKSIARQAAGRYSVDGSIAMVTSVEMVKGGAFQYIPVHLTVQNVQGRWLITEYKQ